jgi:hypothetical protein
MFSITPGGTYIRDWRPPVYIIQCNEETKWVLVFLRNIISADVLVLQWLSWQVLISAKTYDVLYSLYFLYVCRSSLQANAAVSPSHSHVIFVSYFFKLMDHLSFPQHVLQLLRASIQVVSKKALQWCSKSYCVANVKGTFTLEGVQIIHSSRCWTMDSLNDFNCKHFRNTRHTATFEMPIF